MSISYDDTQKVISEAVQRLRESDDSMTRVRLVSQDGEKTSLETLAHWIGDLVSWDINIYRMWEEEFEHSDSVVVALQKVAASAKNEQIIPAYAMLDIWMALYGTSHPEFDHFYEANGYAETWAFLTSEVRNQKNQIEDTYFQALTQGRYASRMQEQNAELRIKTDRLLEENTALKAEVARISARWDRLMVEDEVFDYRPTEDDRREQQAQEQQDAS